MDTMNIPTRSDLRSLIDRQKGSCVSLYMPAHRAGSERRQDPIRFKNLVRQAQEQLEAAGVRSPEARGILEPAADLLRHNDFWQHQGDGLAVFAAPGIFQPYRLPLGMNEMAVAGSHFHVKPLLPLFMGDGRFYLLLLSQNSARLFQGTHFQIMELNPAEMPHSLSDALPYDDVQRSLQFHSVGQGRTMFHGHGAPSDDEKRRLLEYFRQLNRGLRDLNRTGNVPLVLAGVEYLHPIFREANTFPWLLEEGIRGNTEELPVQELHRQAWSIVEPAFMEERRKAVQQYHLALGSGQAGREVRAVLPSAEQGRVAALFVTLGVAAWGAYDRETRAVQLHENQLSASEDLLDLAAVYTLQHEGQVYALPVGDMPDKTPVAAVYRY